MVKITNLTAAINDTDAPCFARLVIQNHEIFGVESDVAPFYRIQPLKIRGERVGTRNRRKIANVNKTNVM